MDETPTPENPVKKDFNKLDLSQLQGFSFGTQWSQEKADPRGRSGMREESSHREGGFGPGGGGGRDRRGFRRPLGGPGDAGPSEAPAGGSGDARQARENRPAGGGDYRGGPRRDGPSGGPGGNRGDFRGGQPSYGQGGGERGEYRGGGSRFGGPREGGVRPEDRGPYISPYFTVTFYPEDASFAALAKTIRHSCRTFELFDIAKTVIGKPERFVVVVARKTPETDQTGAPAAASAKLAPLSLSVPDSLPFETDEAAIAHVLEKHLGLFFDVAEVEVDPPKGNFQVINKCGVTGELLGPPNYHRYNQILQQHHTSRIKGLSFEAYRSRVESVRDPEAVTQWQEKMKKVTRYTWKLGTAPAGEGETPAPILFDSFEDARLHLLSNAREKLVRPVDGARFHGVIIATLPPGEIRHAIEGALERQRRFPLDTANALRGRLRRESFTIFKKGSKGISYVCAVKRKFRVPGQTFAESIGNLISFVETNPMVRAADLPTRLLGIHLPPPPATPPVEGAAPEPVPTLTVEEQAKLSRMQGDLRWLITEGYVTEFLDGRLFAPPAMVEARKKEIENAEHDPENFPDSPAPEPVKRTVVPVAAPVAEAPEAVVEAPVESTVAEEALPTEDEAAPAVASEPVAETPHAEIDPLPKTEGV